LPFACVSPGSPKNSPQVDDLDIVPGCVYLAQTIQSLLQVPIGEHQVVQLFHLPMFIIIRIAEFDIGKSSDIPIFNRPKRIESYIQVSGRLVGCRPDERDKPPEQATGQDKGND
jgi:hypothetical protein